jgi:fimbrial chaperone protein
MLLRSFLVALVAAVAGPVFAADLSIMPVALHFDRQRDRTTVHVTNNGSEPVVLQAEAIAWQREGGVDSDAPTADLIVNPPVFTIAPGRSQIVRVGLRRAQPAEHEATYRMVLREVPVPREPDASMVTGAVRVLVALRVPVYVAPAAVRREALWRARVDADGHVVAHLHNAGNVHLKVGAIRVHGDEQRAPIVARGPESVVFPGEARSWRVVPAGTLAVRPLTLEVTTDRGVQHVALDLVRD